METVLVHWRAIGTFLEKLPRGFVELYKNEVDFHRAALEIAQQLRDGYAPETLARQFCLSEGAEVGSARYHELLGAVLKVKERFKLPGNNFRREGDYGRS